jgi:ABC-2 type transport system ATP-binding protein
VEQICDRAAVVSDGRVLAIGGLDELLGSGGVRIRLTGLTEGGRAALTRRGGLSEQDGWCIVNGVDSEAVPELIADLVATGARVYAVEPVRQTLEERFLALIEAEQARWQR